MTPKQADLIRHSFDAIWPVRRKVAELFYRRFFELAPDAQRLFPSDMERQHLKLMDMIAAIVGALDEHELFQSIIRHTGRQHADLGVKRSHFDAFGDALIWCLEHQFGAAFPPELREAWMTQLPGGLCSFGDMPYSRRQLLRMPHRDLARRRVVVTHSGHRKHSRDLPIGLLVTDRAMEWWYHPSVA